MKEEKSTHTGSYGFIIKNDKIALIKKARGGYTGLLDLPGGGIEHTETPIEALHRECKEEINATVIKEELLDVTATNIKWQMQENLIEDLHHIGVLYTTEIKEKELKDTPDGIDSNGGLWLEINKITKDNSSPFLWYSLTKLGYK